MKILVIGNCQARPLSQLLCDGNLNTALKPIIVHLAKPDDVLRDRALMSEADIIVAQNTAKSFEPEHLRSNKVKEEYNDKTIIWPNVFYIGQTPYLRYVTHKTAGRLIGPLEAYHDLRFLSNWYSERLGISYPEIEIDVDEVSAKSLDELQRREAQCDIEISDIIENYGTLKRIFFTFNHPSRLILEALAKRIAEKAGIKRQEVSKTKWEPLGRIVPPSIFDNPPRADSQFMGLVTNDEGRIVRYTYSEESLCKAFFDLYDKSINYLADPASLRITPNYGS